MYRLLNHIHSPSDLKSLSVRQLEFLCKEIRHKILHTVSATGGHLASNLGVVELSVALHRVFNVPMDQIVWDVGHQSYAHKILTGRMKEFDTIRTKEGLSGYPKRDESPYDAFNTGHSSTSISAALGIAQAKKLTQSPGHVLAVIGDGALTGGLAYEGLNNAGRFNRNFIVILNDNTMSISRNVGSMSRYLTMLRTTPTYLKAKGDLETVLDKIPLLGPPTYKIIHRSKAVVKRLLYNSTIFEDMGFTYYGPCDGHNLGQLLDTLERVKTVDHPVLLHVVTRKGKGYSYAENNPGAFHGVSSFNIQTGKGASSSHSFSNVFGSALCNLAKKDPKICAITAAMQEGTGLTKFASLFSERFFDVGIAEQHAVTFAGGLAAGGMLPVCAIYSTFLQRAFDQVIHDAALQDIKMVLAIDRAGLVGEDGETHQGLFDVPFLNSVPHVTVYSPSYYDELTHYLAKSLYDNTKITAIRYPRGKELYRPADFQSDYQDFDVYGEEDTSILLITYGRIFSHACKAKELLYEKGIPIRIIKLNRIKSIPSAAVSLAAQYQQVFFFEEGMLQGGVGEAFCYQLSQLSFGGEYDVHAIDGQFVKHATVAQSFEDLQLDAQSMVQKIYHKWSKKHE